MEQATCVAGVLPPPTIVLPSTIGVVYTIEPTDLGNGTRDVVVTVTATVQDGFEWDQLPAWDLRRRRDGDPRGDAGRDILAAVTPVAPTLTQALCVQGA